MVTYFLLLFLFFLYFLKAEDLGEFALLFTGVRCAGVLGVDGVLLNIRARKVLISVLLKRRRAAVRVGVTFLRATGRAGACGVLTRMRDEGFVGVL